MRNLLFVTVGVSSLEAPRRMIRAPGLSRKADLEELALGIQEFRDDKTPGKTAIGSPLYRSLLALHLGFWHQPEVPWDDAKRVHETSAELLTTAVLLRKLAHDTGLAVDQAVLLVPRNPEAELAGAVVKAVMESREYKAHCPAAPVLTRPLPDIEEKGAVEALPSELLRAVAENRESETDRIIFNATAGYGATLILIGMLALRYGFRVYYQHEKMPSPIFISQNIHIGWDARTWVIPS